MTPAIAALDETKYTIAAGRMLSGMLVLFLLSAGPAAMLTYATASLVLMLHRERDYGRLLARVAAGICAALSFWALLYCRSAQMRLVMPLW